MLSEKCEQRATSLMASSSLYLYKHSKSSQTLQDYNFPHTFPACKDQTAQGLESKLKPNRMTFTGLSVFALGYDFTFGRSGALQHTKNTCWQCDQCEIDGWAKPIVSLLIYLAIHY